MTDHHVVVREMTITHDDFLRLLPKALKNYTYKILNNNIAVSLAAGSLKIALSEQTHTNIGSLVLPLIQVSFDFYHCPEAVRLGFFEEFDLAFQKGGG